MGHYTCRAIFEAHAPQGASLSSPATTPEIIESSVSTPPCSEEVRKESTGDDAGHAEEKEHAPQEGARQTEADAAELAC
jgi:hypothetical protein